MTVCAVIASLQCVSQVFLFYVSQPQAFWVWTLLFAWSNSALTVVFLPSMTVNESPQDQLMLNTSMMCLGNLMCSLSNLLLLGSTSSSSLTVLGPVMIITSIILFGCFSLSEW
jgi:hypothetical protein